MAYLLDSDVVIYHLADIPEAVALTSRLAEDGIAVSVLTYIEVYQSTLRSSNPADAEGRLHAFLGAVPVLPFSTVTARRCAQLRENLRLQGKRVRQRALDLQIAATALEHDLTLVSRNREDFADISDLKTLFYEAS
jgi:predicted nucleic acid-binding protein